MVKRLAALILPAYYLSDATFTLCKRVLRYEKVWQAHSEHAYQQAVRSGMTHRQVVCRMTALNMLLVVLAMIIPGSIVAAIILLFTAYILTAILLYAFTHYLLLNNRSHLLTAFHDTAMAGASFSCALSAAGRRKNDKLSGQVTRFSGLFCMAICFVVFSRLRLYGGMWRYASTPDLIAITQAATLAMLLFYLGLFLFNRLEGMPRSVPFIEWLLLLAFLGGPRFLYRILRDRQMGVHTSLKGDNRIPVLLIGAGDRAELSCAIRVRPSPISGGGNCR